jgi:AbrB family looped-hinge helix DNA binding protein
MLNIVSITSQGQISIPAKFRKALGLKNPGKAYVKLEQGRLVVEPIPDFLQLAGELRSKAKTGKSIETIIKLEKKAAVKARIDKYHKKIAEK